MGQPESDETADADTEDVTPAEPRTQFVMGVIGTTTDLFDRLDQEIREQGKSWTEVARDTTISRQAFLAAVRRDRVSYAQISRLSFHLGIDPFSLFTVIDPKDNANIY